MVVEVDHPSLGRIRMAGPPVKMSETPPVAGRPAPLLGQHTREVLAEVGYSEADIVDKFL
jgi:crotonobetainyl-CoA:carnitine CoA-transferase CaiB-like acyl-CoA transferase